MKIDLSRKNPFYSILQEATLLSAVEIFACGTHRGMWINFIFQNKLLIFALCFIVSILKSNGEIGSILSQSSVVKYLFENRKQFPEIDKALNKSVSSSMPNFLSITHASLYVDPRVESWG